MVGIVAPLRGPRDRAPIQVVLVVGGAHGGFDRRELVLPISPAADLELNGFQHDRIKCGLAARIEDAHPAVRTKPVTRFCTFAVPEKYATTPSPYSICSWRAGL